MSKTEFIKLWAQIEPVVTKPVNGHIAIDCDCEFIDHVGGYQLNLYPRCLMWPNELMFVLSACDLLCCCAACSFSNGLIRIY